MMVAAAVGFGLYSLFAVIKWRAALVCFVAVFPLLPGLAAPPGLPELSVYRALLIPILLGWTLSRLTVPIRTTWSRLTVAMVVWVGVNILASIASVDVIGSLKRTLTLAEYVPLLYMVSAIDAHPTYRRRIRLALTLGLLAVLGYTTVEIITGANPFFDAGWFQAALMREDYVHEHMRAGSTRVAGPMGQPINLGLYLSMVVPIVAVIINSEFRRWRWLLLGLLIPLSVLVEIRTFSRGPWVGAAVAGIVAVGIWAYRRRRFSILIKATVVVAVVGALSAAYATSDMVDFFNSTFGIGGARQDPNVSGRIDIVGATLAIVKERPVFGLGPGVTFHELGDPNGALSVRFAGLGQVENQYAYVLLDTGVVGLAAYLFLLWRLWLVAIRRTSLLEDGARSAAQGLALVSACVVFMVTSISVQVAGFQTMMFVILMGLAFEGADRGRFKVSQDLAVDTVGRTAARET